MAFTQAQYDALTDAISQGVLRVKYADKEVEYRSLNEMITLRLLMATELGLKKSGRAFGKFNKGLNGHKFDSPGCDNLFFD